MSVAVCPAPYVLRRLRSHGSSFFFGSARIHWFDYVPEAPDGPREQRSSYLPQVSAIYLVTHLNTDHPLGTNG
jgi:hypothetical protein